MTTTVESPRDPKTREEWQNAADAADARQKIDSAKIYGLVTGGPEIDAGRCWELVHRAKDLYSTEPREDVVERFLSGLVVDPDGDS